MAYTIIRIAREVRRGRGRRSARPYRTTGSHRRRGGSMVGHALRLLRRHR